MLKAFTCFIIVDRTCSLLTIGISAAHNAFDVCYYELKVYASISFIKDVVIGVDNII